MQATCLSIGMLDSVLSCKQQKKKLPSPAISVFWGCSVRAVSEVLNELRRRGCRVLAGWVCAGVCGLVFPKGCVPSKPLHRANRRCQTWFLTEVVGLHDDDRAETSACSNMQRSWRRRSPGPGAHLALDLAARSTDSVQAPTPGLQAEPTLRSTRAV